MVCPTRGPLVELCLWPSPSIRDLNPRTCQWSASIDWRFTPAFDCLRSKGARWRCMLAIPCGMPYRGYHTPTTRRFPEAWMRQTWWNGCGNRAEGDAWRCCGRSWRRQALYFRTKALLSRLAGRYRRLDHVQLPGTVTWSRWSCADGRWRNHNHRAAGVIGAGSSTGRLHKIPTMTDFVYGSWRKGSKLNDDQSIFNVYVGV